MTEVVRPPRRFHQICGRSRPYSNAPRCTGELYVVALVANATILVCSTCDRPELEACARDERAA